MCFISCLPILCHKILDILAHFQVHLSCPCRQWSLTNTTPQLVILWPRAADAAGVRAQTCLVAPSLRELRARLLGWPRLPGSTALPHAAFKMLLAWQAATLESQLPSTSGTSPPRTLGPGPRHSRASCNAAQSSVHLVVCTPMTQSTSNWFPAHVCVVPPNTIKTKASSLQHRLTK